MFMCIHMYIYIVYYYYYYYYDYDYKSMVYIIASFEGIP